MTKKYKVPVYILSTASKYIGEVEFDTIEEYNEKKDKLWEKLDYDTPSLYACNDFDLGDWDIEELEDNDLEYYKQN